MAKKGPIRRPRLSERYSKSETPQSSPSDPAPTLTRNQIKLLIGAVVGVLAIGGYVVSQDQKEAVQQTTSAPTKPQPKPVLTPEQQTEQVIKAIETEFPNYQQILEKKLHFVPESMQAPLMAPFVIVQQNKENPFKNYYNLAQFVADKGNENVQIRQDSVYYFSYNTDTIAEDHINAAFNNSTRTLTLRDSFNINNFADFLTLYHELIHAGEDAETRKIVGSKAYFEYHSITAPKILVDEEAIAYARQIEVFNLWLDNQLYENPEQVKKSKDQSINDLIEMAKLYYPSRQPGALYQLIAARHRELRYQLWLRDGSHGFKPFVD